MQLLILAAKKPPKPDKGEHVAAAFSADLRRKAISGNTPKNKKLNLLSKLS